MKPTTLDNYNDFLHEISILYRKKFKHDYFDEKFRHTYDKNMGESNGISIPNISVSLPIIDKNGKKMVLSSVMEHGLFTVRERKLIIDEDK